MSGAQAPDLGGAAAAAWPMGTVSLLVTVVPDLTLRPKHTTEDRVVRPLLFLAATFSGLVITVVMAFVIAKAMPTFRTEFLPFLTTGGWDVQLNDAWDKARIIFGARELIINSLLTTGGAMAVSLLLGLGCAIFLSELSPPALRRPLEAVMQLLAGIPSVVFGLVGLAVVVPFITDHLIPKNASDVVTEIPVDGASLLAAVVVLSFMVVPFFVMVSVDALRSIPRGYMDGGLALGMTKWRAITRIQVPAAAPGLIAGLMLAAARAIGEAIAISLVGGSIAWVPNMAHGPLYFLLEPVRTMASTIFESGDMMDVPSIQSALFGLATILLFFSFALSLGARWSFTWFNKRMHVDTGRRV